MLQKTVSKPVAFSGKGIHSGKICKVKLFPAEENQGITFIRKKGDASIRIPADAGHIGNLTRSTGLREGDAEVQTIEHLMAAFYLTGITNIGVETSEKELPILDGGCKGFIKHILKGGIREQGKHVGLLRSSTPFTLARGSSFIAYVPTERTGVTCIIDFPHPKLRNQSLHIDLESETLVEELAAARTFGFEHELEALRKAGLGQGGNLTNTVLLSPFGYINSTLHYPDECIRHKILDFLGDMSLSGKRLQGHFVVCQAGHRLHVEFLKAFLERSED
jgi:UDP-3-O-[3-hydroxymyristoyl] N-acetylglucosamine deacetylase